MQSSIKLNCPPPNKRLELTEVPAANAGQMRFEIKAVAKYRAYIEVQ